MRRALAGRCPHFDTAARRARPRRPRFERNGDYWDFAAGFTPYGELMGKVPLEDENLAIIYSLILPEGRRGQGIPEQMYDAWGGRATAVFPDRSYPFLDG